MISSEYRITYLLVRARVLRRTFVGTPSSLQNFGDVEGGRAHPETSRSQSNSEQPVGKSRETVRELVDVLGFAQKYQ